MSNPELNVQTVHKHTLTGNDADRSPSPRGVQLMAAPINGYPTHESTHRRHTGIDMATRIRALGFAEKHPRLSTAIRGVSLVAALGAFGNAFNAGNDGNVNVQAKPIYSVPIIGNDTPNSFIDSNGNRVIFIAPKSVNK